MMVANPSRFQVMFMGLDNDCKLCVGKNKMVITTVDKVKPQGATNDSKLKFDERVKSVYLKATTNISALFRIAKILDQPKCKLLFNPFVMSNFRYSPLIWMFCGKLLINQ